MALCKTFGCPVSNRDTTIFFWAIDIENLCAVLIPVINMACELQSYGCIDLTQESYYKRDIKLILDIEIVNFILLAIHIY